MQSNYGYAISKLRKDKNMTQEQLGKKLNISYQAVSKWENNQSQPDFQTLEKLVEIFGISLNEFFEIAKSEQKVQMSTTNTSTTAYSTNVAPTNISKFNKIILSPWFLVSILSALVILFGSIAIFVPRRYNLSQLYNRTSDAVFYASTQQESGFARYCTGFFIDSSGVAVILNNDAANIKSGTLTLKDGKYTTKKYNIVSVLGYDDDSPYAIVKVDIKRARCLSIGNSNAVNIADKTYVVGFYDVAPAINECLVSQVNYDGDNKTFDLAAAVNAAGIVFNSRGQIIGMTTGRNSSGLISTTPISHIRDIKRDVNKELQIDTLNSVSQYVIKFDAKGGTGTMQDQVCYVNKTYNLSENEYVKKGYLFTGWSDGSVVYEDGQSIKNFAEVGETVVLTAQWEPIHFQVKYCYQDQEPYYQEMVYAQTVQLLPNRFVFDHATFDHWDCSNGSTYVNSCNSAVLTTVNNDIVTMTAVTKDFTYNIKYVGKCNNIVLYNTTLTYNYRETYTVRTADNCTGYVFKYWVDQNGNQYHSDSSLGYTTTFSKLCGENGGQITFTGVYDEVVYRVYIKNSITDEVYDLGSKSYSERFTLPECPFEPEYGYVFVNYKKQTNIYTSGYYYCYVGNEFRGSTINGGYAVHDNDEYIFWAMFDTIKYKINYYLTRNNSQNHPYYQQTCEYGQDCLIGHEASINLGDRTVVGDYWIDDDGNKYKHIDRDGDTDGYITTINLTYSGTSDVINLYLVTKVRSFTIYFKNSSTGEITYIGEKLFTDEYLLPECFYEIPTGYEFWYYDVRFDGKNVVGTKPMYPGEDLCESCRMDQYYRTFSVTITVMFQRVSA